MQYETGNNGFNPATFLQREKGGKLMLFPAQQEHPNEEQRKRERAKYEKELVIPSVIPQGV